MRRAAPWAALAVAAAVVVYVLVPQKPPASTPLRPPPAVPTPTPEEKVAYFYRLLRSGDSVDVAAPLAGASPLQISVWREIAAPALIELGEPALTYLASPDRYPEYVATPDVLVAVLQLLPRAPYFAGLVPFLAHWLDDRNCPPRSQGADWPDEIRKLVFQVLRAFPVPEAVPLCVEEIRRARRVHDNRGAAIDILLQVADPEVIEDLYAVLAPTADAPEADLRASVLARLYQMAAPTSGDRFRAQVSALEPLLRKAVESPRPVEQLNAIGALYRLGKPGTKEEMETALERFYEQYRDNNEPAAWNAILFLATDEPTEYAHEACLQRIEHPDNGPGFLVAVRMLLKWWPDEIEPKLLEWLRSGEHVDPYTVLPGLLRHDRKAVVEWLRGVVGGASLSDLQRALGFIAGEGITELGPDLIGLVRRTEVSLRPIIYQALVKLRTPAIEALLIAELDASIPAEFKAAAAVELLNLGEKAGIERLHELIAEGDGAALDALLRRARAGGGGNVPAALVPAVLEALRKIPGEEGRRAALLVLRFRGELADVREGLIEAYRREPSRRVAKEIQDTIIELAHR